MSTPSASAAPSVLKLAVIEGDGIGKEVVPQGLRALRAALERVGVDLELRRAGAGPGTTVHIGGVELEWGDDD